jgi:hypothetical protein
MSARRIAEAATTFYSKPAKVLLALLSNAIGHKKPDQCGGYEIISVDYHCCVVGLNYIVLPVLVLLN